MKIDNLRCLKYSKYFLERILKMAKNFVVVISIIFIFTISCGVSNNCRQCEESDCGHCTECEDMDKCSEPDMTTAQDMSTTKVEDTDSYCPPVENCDIVSRCEFATLLKLFAFPEENFDFVATGPSFPDVPADLYCWEEVEILAQAELITGYPDGTFRPYIPLNRAEATKLVVLAFDIPDKPCEGQLFSDVSGEWYESYAERAALSGLLCGAQDTKGGCAFNNVFEGAKNISRPWLMRVLKNALHPQDSSYLCES
ncbi:hypothetical protein GF366_04200 [Candidatus Peregrinibacteria bacterium]|nr:hypothetical protein [Candidatus Peregrinibacteria bacterium]